MAYYCILELTCADTRMKKRFNVISQKGIYASIALASRPETEADQASGRIFSTQSVSR